MNSHPSDTPLVWRCAGGDASRRGRCDVEWAPAHRPRVRFEASGALQASVVFAADGSAFVADLTGRIAAFDARGHRRWQVRLAAGVLATPALPPSDAALYLGTLGGEVVALDAATGETRWRRDIPTRKDPRILSDLLFETVSRTVVLSSWGGRFVALDGESGELRGDWDAGVSPRSAASADTAGRVYCLRSQYGRGTELIRVTPRAGAVEAVLRLEPEDSRGASRALVAAAPVIDESRAVAYFVVNRERSGHLLAWSTERPGIVWRHEFPASIEATPTVLPGGVVVVADLAGHVHGLDPDGTRRFDCALACDYLLAAGIAAGSDRFVIGDPLGTVHAVDTRGSRRTLFETPRSIQARPSVDPSGALHIACTDGRCYRLTS